jgi:hypothetical protein
MAIYVSIRKIADKINYVEYSYGVSDDKLGRLNVDKQTGEISIIEVAPGDSQGRFSSRAIYKLTQHWEAGELPDVTCWAS